MEKEADFHKIKGSEKVSSPTVRVNNIDQPVSSQDIKDEYLKWSKIGKEERNSSIYNFFNDENNRIQELHEQSMKLRKRYSKRVYRFLIVFSLFCAAVIIFQGFSLWSFHLDEISMSTLICGTAISVISLVRTILHSLFPSNDYKSKSREFLKIINKN